MTAERRPTGELSGVLGETEQQVIDYIDEAIHHYANQLEREGRDLSRYCAAEFGMLFGKLDG